MAAEKITEQGDRPLYLTLLAQEQGISNCGIAAGGQRERPLVRRPRLDIHSPVVRSRRQGLPGGGIVWRERDGLAKSVRRLIPSVLIGQRRAQVLPILGLGRLQCDGLPGPSFGFCCPSLSPNRD